MGQDPTHLLHKRLVRTTLEGMTPSRFPHWRPSQAWTWSWTRSGCPGVSSNGLPCRCWDRSLAASHPFLVVARRRMSDSVVECPVLLKSSTEPRATGSKAVGRTQLTTIPPGLYLGAARRALSHPLNHRAISVAFRQERYLGSGRRRSGSLAVRDAPLEAFAASCCRAGEKSGMSTSGGGLWVIKESLQGDWSGRRRMIVTRQTGDRVTPTLR